MGCDMRNIILVRHPAVNLPAGYCYGQTDVALEAGWQSLVEQLREHLAKENWLIASSPASRCLMIAESLSPQKIYVDPRLQELNFGIWEGQAWDQIASCELDYWASDFIGRSPPNGESFLELFQRSSNCLIDLCQKDQNIIIISHAGVIRSLLCLIFSRRLKEAFSWQIPFGSSFPINLDANLKALDKFASWSSEHRL